MLFGNQPFIADMTAAAITAPSTAAAEMRERFARRVNLVAQALDGYEGLAVARPEAGMFVLIDARALELSGETFALRLLEETGVAVMPGSSFGTTLDGWVRLSLTVDDRRLAEAVQRIAAFASQSRPRKIA